MRQCQGGHVREALVNREAEQGGQCGDGDPGSVWVWTSVVNILPGETLERPAQKDKTYEPKSYTGSCSMSSSAGADGCWARPWLNRSSRRLTNRSTRKPG